LRDEPLEYTFITEDKLTEVLYHAGPLGPKVFNRLHDKVDVGVTSPSGRLCGTDALRPLSFQHVQHAINCAEGTGATTAGTAVYQDRPLATRLWILTPEAPIAGGANDFVTLLDQIEEVGRLRSGPEIRPVRILKLCNFPEWLKGERSVKEAEVPDDDDRVLIGVVGTLWRLTR